MNIHSPAARPDAALGLPARPDAATLARPGVAAIWKTAQDFEAMAIGQMLAPIFDTVDSAAGPFGGGAGEQAWRPMITQEMGKHIAAGGGFGLAVPVFHQMLRIQALASEKDTRS